MQPAFVMSGGRTLERARAVQMSEDAKLNVLESHIRPEPIGTVASLALFALGRTGRLECRLGREMRLADESGLIAAARQRPGEALRADCRIEIDSVVPHAMRQRQHAGKNRCARRLTHEVRRHTCVEACAFTRETI